MLELLTIKSNLNKNKLTNRATTLFPKNKSCVEKINFWGIFLKNLKKGLNFILSNKFRFSTTYRWEISSIDKCIKAIGSSSFFFLNVNNDFYKAKFMKAKFNKLLFTELKKTK